MGQPGVVVYSFLSYLCENFARVGMGATADLLEFVLCLHNYAFVMALKGVGPAEPSAAACSADARCGHVNAFGSEARMAARRPSSASPSPPEPRRPEPSRAKPNSPARRSPLIASDTSYQLCILEMAACSPA